MLQKSSLIRLKWPISAVRRFPSPLLPSIFLALFPSVITNHLKNAPFYNTRFYLPCRNPLLLLDKLEHLRNRVVSD